jgi:4-aminobutyrate aminotransferase-like enzyme
MTMTNAFDPTRADRLQAAEQAMIERRSRLLGPAYRLFYERPLHFVRGEGVWLIDATGERYLDAYNNVASVGHCRAEVVDAIAAQARILNTHTRYLDDTILDYAERLLATFPPVLSHAMFTCTGSEANDLALRIARRFTGNEGVIVTEFAYHGTTEATAELSPSLGKSVIGKRIRTVPAPNGEGERFADDVRQAIADMAAAGLRPAALLVDTLFSSDGVRVDPAGFLAPAVNVVRAAGGLFIADEVQAGFARSGEAFWGFARHGLVPDLVTMGKPMGNGHPVAAVVAQPRVVARFGEEVRYFNTFGGNPVSCAAAGAVLDVIEKEGLQANARAVGGYLAEELRACAKTSDLLGEVRAAGLFVGVDVLDEDGKPSRAKAAEIVNAMRDRRVLISATGADGATLKVRPPLIFARDHVDRLVAALSEAAA